MDLTRDFLIEQYAVLKKSGGKIARELGLRRWTVDNAITKHGIERRPIREARRPPGSSGRSGFKWCPRCKSDLPVDNFNRNKRVPGGRTTYCRSCCSTIAKHKRYAAVRRRRMKAEAVMRFGNKCSRCGASNLPTACYQFHHRSGKTIQIGKLLGYSNDRLEPELSKCDMLCANCHHVEHWGSETATDIMLCSR